MRINLYLPDGGGRAMQREAMELAEAKGITSFSGLVTYLLREFITKERRKAARKAGE